MNWKTISRNVGAALLVSALFMFLSIVVSVIDGNDSALAALMISFTITLIVGAFPFIFVSGTRPITLKEGYIIITLSWLLSFLFGMLPYALWGGPFTIQNAWFESVSGFTTTGATSLEKVELLPRSLLFWRSSTHFIGGLGVVVFLLLIIPDSSPMKMRLSNMELSSLSKGAYSARANKTVYIFAYVYIAICVAALAFYTLAGMPFFDAVCHAMSVCATGGFSTKNLSILAFDSRLIEGGTMFFMVVASCHFGLVYLSVINRSLKPLDNPVLKFYLCSLAVLSLLLGISIKSYGLADSLPLAMWQGLFQTICIASTTGFAITDNLNWPFLPNVLVLVTAVMCGCAGSTSGGVKADRILVLFKSIGSQIGRILHPTSVNEVRLGGRVIRDEELFPHILYISLYFLALFVSVILCLLSGMEGPVALSSSICSLSNVGPATAELGFMGNFGSVPLFAKIVLTFDMFLGRVEIFPILSVIAMVFEKSRR